MTDLDGTLLGHEDFGFAPIRDRLLDLIDSGIKIVPNSSKTRREIDVSARLLARVFLMFSRMVPGSETRI